MSAEPSTANPARAARVAALSCVGAAVVAAGVFALFGKAPAGGALAVGLLLGSLNGAAAGKLVALPVPFIATSLTRLITLSMFGILIGLAFGVSRIWLVILGLGLAQMLLVGAALRESIRR